LSSVKSATRRSQRHVTEQLEQRVVAVGQLRFEPAAERRRHVAQMTPEALGELANQPQKVVVLGLAIPEAMSSAILEAM